MRSALGAEYHIDDGIITVTRPEMRPITGTYLAALIGKNPYKSPFEAVCELTGIYRSSFHGNIYTRAGKILESKILKRYSENASASVKSGAELYPDGCQVGPHDTWINHLTSKDGRLAGNIDGAIVDDGKITGVIEIKTAKSLASWVRGDVILPPEHYVLQAGLYARLLDVDDIIMLAYETTPYDLSDPEGSQLEGHMYAIPTPVPAHMDGYIADAEEVLDSALEGIRIPTAPSVRDRAVIDALYVDHPDDKALSDAVKSYENAARLATDAEMSIRPLLDARDEAKARLKIAALDSLTDDVSRIECGAVSVSRTDRVSYDVKAMEKAGIYLTPYTKKTSYIAIRTKKE
ncbi:MAG: YqaJ viral recombinase family protein [Sphaerochaetaceae bacterium]